MPPEKSCEEIDPSVGLFFMKALAKGFASFQFDWICSEDVDDPPLSPPEEDPPDPPPADADEL